jgi:hypothetical protein
VPPSVCLIVCATLAFLISNNLVDFFLIKSFE